MDEQIAAVRELIRLAETINAIQHAGNRIPPSYWSDLNTATDKANVALWQIETELKQLAGDLRTYDENR